MTHSPIRLSESYSVSEAQRSTLSQGARIYGHAQPAPDELGGYFDFVNWQGTPISYANFLGRWTLLYFGYSRCHGSCLAVAPKIADAAAALRYRGLPVRAMFVDIESPPVGAITRLSERDGRHTHGTNWNKRIAMAQMALTYGNKLDVLTGSRFQLSKATAAYHVIREHVPPRAKEANLSINHSSIIYLLGLDTLVAGYGYHDMEVDQIVALVEQLDQAKRKKIDRTAIRRRFSKGECGA